MRLWHYKLIPALSNMHLRTQWNELCAITGMMRLGRKHATTVDRIKNSRPEDLHLYIYLVEEEMKRRGMKVSPESLETLRKNINYSHTHDYHIAKTPDLGVRGSVSIEYGHVECYNGEMLLWMGNRYLVQNFFMLQEKADIGMISQEDLRNTESVMKNAGIDLSILNEISKE